jgi:hypothetical protein
MQAKTADATLTAPGPITNQEWAIMVLQDGGFPVTQNNITSMLQWMASEEPPSNWWDRNNPLNNGLGSGGGAGLGSYPDLTTAALDAAANINAGDYGYQNIAAALSVSADPAITAKAIQNSSWAGGHYGYGASWHSGPVAIVSHMANAVDATTATATATDTSFIGSVGQGIGAAAGSAANLATGGLYGDLKNATSEASAVEDFLTLLANPAFWERVGVFTLGAAFVIVGLVVFISTTSTGQKVESEATSAGEAALVA